MRILRPGDWGPMPRAALNPKQPWVPVARSQAVVASAKATAALVTGAASAARCYWRCGAGGRWCGEQLGVVDEEPLQLGLVPVVGRLLNGGQHVLLKLRQQVGGVLALPLSILRQRLLLASGLVSICA